MNLIEHWITAILSEPEERYNKFWVRVAYTCEGGKGESNLIFNTLEEAKQIKVNDKFLA